LTVAVGSEMVIAIAAGDHRGERLRASRADGRGRRGDGDGYTILERCAGIRIDHQHRRVDRFEVRAEQLSERMKV
jgi:hypothetical protein